VECSDTVTEIDTSLTTRSLSAREGAHDCV